MTIFLCVLGVTKVRRGAFDLKRPLWKVSQRVSKSSLENEFIALFGPILLKNRVGMPVALTNLERIQRDREAG